MECGWLGDETAVVMAITVFFVFLRCVVMCGFGRTFELTVSFGGVVWGSSLGHSARGVFFR